MVTREMFEKAAANIGAETTVLPHHLGMVYCGKDDNNGVPMGREISVQATAHQSACAIFPANVEIVAADHDF